MINEEKIFLALRHGSILITGWQPGEDVVLAAARSPRGRAKHVCNLAAWHDTASSECYSPETGPELLSLPSCQLAGSSSSGYLAQDRLNVSLVAHRGKRGDVGQLTEVKSSIIRAFCWGPSSGVSHKWVSVLGKGRIIWGNAWQLCGAINAAVGASWEMESQDEMICLLRSAETHLCIVPDDGQRLKAEMIIGILRADWSERILHVVFCKSSCH